MKKKQTKIAILIVLYIGQISCNDSNKLPSIGDINRMHIESLIQINKDLISEIISYELLIENKVNYYRINIEVNSLINCYNNFNNIVQSNSKEKILSLIEETNRLSEKILNRRLNLNNGRMRNTENVVKKRLKELNKIVEENKKEGLINIQNKKEVLFNGLFRLVTKHKEIYEMTYDNFDLLVRSDINEKENKNQVEIYPLIGNTDLFDIEIFVNNEEVEFNEEKLSFITSKSKIEKDSFEIMLSAVNKNNGIISIVKQKVEIE